MMKTFVGILYDYNFTGKAVKDDEEESDDEIELAIESERGWGDTNKTEAVNKKTNPIMLLTDPCIVISG